jgi:hypothetical protein
MKFSGSLQDLETVVCAIGRTINSSADKGNMYQIKTNEGETINLYKTGTLQVQASPVLKQNLKKISINTVVTHRVKELSRFMHPQRQLRQVLHSQSKFLWYMDTMKYQESSLSWFFISLE